jgi:uncharacterized membrane protein (UPF0136 family)
LAGKSSRVSFIQGVATGYAKSAAHCLVSAQDTYVCVMALGVSNALFYAVLPRVMIIGVHFYLAVWTSD